jgi:Bacterial Ig domain
LEKDRKVYNYVIFSFDRFAEIAMENELLLLVLIGFLSVNLLSSSIFSAWVVATTAASALLLPVQSALAQEPDEVCSSGEELVDGECQPICSEGQELVDGECQPICSEGQELVDGECQPIGGECPQGQELVDGECQPIGGECPQGQELVDIKGDGIANECQPIGGECPQGQELVDNQCMPPILCPEAQQWDPIAQICKAEPLPGEPPVAQDDIIATSQGEPVTIYVLDNDADPNGDILTIEPLSQPSNGRAMLGEDGITILYQPGNSFLGVDTFDYKVTNGNGGTDSATVTIKVTTNVYEVPPPNNETNAVVPYKVTLKYNNGDLASLDNIEYIVTFDFGGETFEISDSEKGSFDEVEIIDKDTAIFRANRISQNENRDGVVVFDFPDGGAEKDRKVTIRTDVKINETVQSTTISGDSSILSVMTLVVDLVGSVFRVASDIYDKITPCIALSMDNIDSNPTDKENRYLLKVNNCSNIYQHINLKELLPQGVTLLQLNKVFDIPGKSSQEHELRFATSPNIPTGTYPFEIIASVISKIFDRSHEVASASTTNSFDVQGSGGEPPVVRQFFLDRRIDVFNQDTMSPLSNYVFVQTVPDKFAEQARGIPGQFVTTLAFQDRYGRQDSNNNLNVFLQISHTNEEVTSLRGVQLGGDDIQLVINGVDQGIMGKTVEVSIN